MSFKREKSNSWFELSVVDWYLHAWKRKDVGTKNYILSFTGYRPSPRDRASRGRGGLGPSWASANSGSGGSRGKFVSGGSGRGRHVRSFTR